jgi:hypothetical protein
MSETTQWAMISLSFFMQAFMFWQHTKKGRHP